MQWLHQAAKRQCWVSIGRTHVIVEIETLRRFLLSRTPHFNVNTALRSSSHLSWHLKRNDRVIRLCTGSSFIQDSLQLHVTLDLSYVPATKAGM